MTGNTVYLRRPDGAEAPVFYGADGTAHMQHFEHGLIAGPWSVTAHGYVVEWSAGVGRTEWTLGHEGSALAWLDAEGAERGRMTRIIAGDAAGLAA